MPMTFIETHEVTIRLMAFFTIFSSMAILELYLPKKNRSADTKLRWKNNLALLVFNSILLKIFIPVAASELALWAAKNHIGLFNYLDFPLAISIILSLFLLDAIIWFQHVIFHRVPILWRLHAVHHTDKDLDVTSAGRFHTVEILLSMLIKMTAVLLFGIPVVAVILFEVILNGMAMFNHSNLRLPNQLNFWLSKLIITPDLHRIHHSVYKEENDTNFGFNLVIWDKLFGTYLSAPRDGHKKMQLGLMPYRDDKDVTLLSGLLLFPFRAFSHSKKSSTKESHD